LAAAFDPAVKETTVVAAESTDQTSKILASGIRDFCPKWAEKDGAGVDAKLVKRATLLGSRARDFGGLDRRQFGFNGHWEASLDFQMHPQSMRRMEKGPLVPNPAGRRWFHPRWPSIRPGRSTISDLTGFRPFGASRIRRGSAEQGRRRSAVVGAICPSLGQYPRGARPDAETGWVIGCSMSTQLALLGSLAAYQARQNEPKGAGHLPGHLVADFR
jgi:hypothetical protein